MIMGEFLRFHAVFHAFLGGEDGIRYGELARKFRRRELRIAPSDLRTMLADLVDAGALAVQEEGRTRRYWLGPAGREFLRRAGGPPPAGLRYDAKHVVSLLAFLADVPEAEQSLQPLDLQAAVRSLAEKTATGLVSLADLRRHTGLSRERVHEAVKQRVAAGELLLHPIAARHQATSKEMEDGIRTPGGQNLFYVEVV
jgi:hypothetical protein